MEDLTPNDDRIPIGKNVLQLKNIRETAVYTCFAQSNLGMKEINTTVKVQCESLLSPSQPTQQKIYMNAYKKTNELSFSFGLSVLTTAHATF